jgi:hypothetical protein
MFCHLFRIASRSISINRSRQFWMFRFNTRFSFSKYAS